MKFRNTILQKMPAAGLQQLAPDLTSHKMRRRHRIETQNRAIAHVYFPETCVISVFSNAGEDTRVEAGMVGFEGASGVAVILGDHRSPHDTYVQVAGEAMRASAESVRRLMQENGEARRLLLHFANVLTIQTAHTALANGRASIEQRLARWLLMAHDRVGDPVPVAHDCTAAMLGVRRADVTNGLRALEADGLVECVRGKVSIIDHAGLSRRAGAIYGVPEAEYRRLIG